MDNGTFLGMDPDLVFEFTFSWILPILLILGLLFLVFIGVKSYRDTNKKEKNYYKIHYREDNEIYALGAHIVKAENKNEAMIQFQKWYYRRHASAHKVHITDVIPL